MKLRALELLNLNLTTFEIPEVLCKTTLSLSPEEPYPQKQHCEN